MRIASNDVNFGVNAANALIFNDNIIHHCNKEVTTNLHPSIITI